MRPQLASLALVFANACYPVTNDAFDGGETCRGVTDWRMQEEWPLDELTLGDRVYTRDEALVILTLDGDDDASVLLGGQVIAAELNVAAGAPESVVASPLLDAQAWLQRYDDDRALPFGIPPASAIGQDARSIADQLEAFNQACGLAEGA